MRKCILLQFEKPPCLLVEDEEFPSDAETLDHAGTADWGAVSMNSVLSFSVYFTRLLKFKSLLFKTDASYEY